MKQLYAQTQHANSNRHDSFGGSASTVQPFGGARRSARVSSLFPVRNKGKGPPGWAPAPEAVYSLPAAASAGSENSRSSILKNNNLIHNQLTNIKSLSIMKKQILILVVIVLAAFANVNEVYGQAVAGSAPRGILCTDNALNPIAGKSYTYQAASNQTGNFTFWATKDMNFISTSGGTTTTNISTKLNSPTTTPVGAALLATSANYATADAADNVQITWSDAVLSATTTAAPTFVAVNQDGTCANNFKVWAITPIKAFTVDIRNIDNAAPTGTPMDFDATDDQCYDQVRGATYNNGTIEYNYGTQVLYYEVIAANFTNSWTPTLTLSALGNGQTAVIEWAYDRAFTSPVTVTSGTAFSAPVLTNLTSTTAGASIYVRVTITNNTYEGRVPSTVTLTVDGVNSVGDWDIENNTLTNAGPLCNAGTANDKMDVATQTINPRPTVTAVAPTPFATGNQTN